MTKPEISLCVMAYNRPKDLVNSIKSYLLQDCNNSEMVIIDDCSPTDPYPYINKLLKKDKRISYHRNKVNLGLTDNFFQALDLCKGKYIVFIGDDDLLIDNTALSEYLYTFKKNNVGLVISKQILFKRFKVDQVMDLNSEKKYEYFQKGLDSLDETWFPTTSIAGYSLKNSSEVKKLRSKSISLYPQFELAGKICINFNTAIINKYLVGVQCHDNQLNPIKYSLNGKNTDILDDLNKVYKRINNIYKIDKKYFFTNKLFFEKVTNFLPLFIPFSSIKNGKIYTLLFCLKVISINTKVLINSVFWISLCLLLIPNKYLIQVLQFIKKKKLDKIYHLDSIKKINIILSKYAF